MTPQLIELSPACSLELLNDKNNEFLGIGRVIIHGVEMRSPVRPIQLRLDTPNGILYPQLELLQVDLGSDGTVRVNLRAHGIRWTRGEYSDDYDQATMWLSESAAAVTDEVALLLKPAVLKLGGREWRGFSYAIAFKSAEREIHRVLLHSTWEIGGQITGNTVLSQGQCNMPVYEGSPEDVFTTACLKTLDQYGSPQGNSLQLGPRGGLLQGFDFQAAKEGALLQFWPELESVSSLVESPAGSNLLHIVDEYRFPLSAEVTTPEKLVLFTPGPLAPHEVHDLWWEARWACYGSVCKRFHITRTLPAPEMGLRYTTRVAEGCLLMNIGGKEVESAEVPYAIAENILPVLAEQGIKRFMPEVMSMSDVSEFGMRRKLDDGLHGELHCASVCGTHRFFPSEFWGGIQGWRVMADKAHALGIEIGAWFAPHLSPRAPIFEEHPEYRMISVTGLPSGGGYGFHSIVVADWNTPIADWLIADLKRWKEEGGLDYIFTDSISNMGMLQANYSAKMRTNFAALGRLYSRIQALGISSLSAEAISPWSYSRFGMADPRGDLIEQNHAIAGQNDFGWWVDHLEMMDGLSFGCSANNRGPEEMEQLLFRTMAAGGYLMDESQYGIDHKIPSWWIRLNLILNRAQPNMKLRRVLPEQAGIDWSNGDIRTIWTFKDVAMDLRAGAKVEALEGHSTRSVEGDGSVTLPAWGVYRVG